MYLDLPDHDCHPPPCLFTEIIEVYSTLCTEKANSSLKVLNKVPVSLPVLTQNNNSTEPETLDPSPHTLIHLQKQGH